MEKKRFAKAKKKIMYLAVFLNVVLLFALKYDIFMVDNINLLFHKSYEFKELLLTVGVSFFTFQQIMYVVDAYRGDQIINSFVDYMVYILYFPKLISGPLVPQSSIVSQLNYKENWRPNYKNISSGLYDFSCGLFKKLLIADTFAKAVNFGFSPDPWWQRTQMDWLITMLSFTLQIYFDFSGYCDMASGISRMLNIELPINFNSPYKATSITEFWDRWHISLSTFFRKYLYFPLGGNRKGKARTYVNILVIFVISGLWHGANWTYVVWGLLHGVADVLTRIFRRYWEKMHVVVQWIITFFFLNVTWLIFRAESVGQAFSKIRYMIRLDDLSISSEITDCFALPELKLICESVPFLMRVQGHVPDLYLFVFLLPTMWIVLNTINSNEVKKKNTLVSAINAVVCLVWSIMSISGISSFIYMNF